MTLVLFRCFLGLLLACMILVAMLGIYSLLYSEMSTLQWRVVLTALTVGAYSLTSLCGSTLLDKRSLRYLGFVCIAASIFGAAFAISTNWIDGVDLQFLLQGRLSLFIISFALAHMSLLFLVKSKNSALVSAKVFTIAAITVLATMLLVVTHNPKDAGGIWRPIFVLVILVSLGTIACPTLSLLTSTKNADDV